MGIRFYCPNGHKLHVKAFQAGMRGICPYCGAKVQIPLHSTRPSTKELKARRAAAKRQQADGQEPAPGGTSVTPAPPEQMTAPSLEPEERVPALSPGAFENLAEILEESEPPQSEALAAGYRAMPVPLDSAVPGLSGSSAISGPPEGIPLQSADALEAADPLADPNVVWYVRPPSGGQYGPAAPEVIRAWIAEARITPDTLVWREGWRDWREARTVFPYLGGAEFPQVPPAEQPEMRFIHSYESRDGRNLWLYFVLALLAAVTLAGVATWFFFLQ